MSGIVGSKFNIRGSGLVGSLGTDGQHMLSAGAGKTNVFETPAAAGGAWNFISNTSISSDSTVLVEGLDSTYQLYKFVYMNIQSDSSNNTWYMKVKSGGSVVTASEYQTVIYAYKSSGSSWTDWSTSAAFMRLNAHGNDTSTDKKQNYIVHMYNPANTSVFTHVATSFTSYINQDDVLFASMGAGVWESTAAVTGLQLSASSGTFITGNIYLYGLAIS